MVEVATGGDSGEQLPMVLKVPHLGSNPLKVCWMPYSMLGFGDILVPGLLLSYCHSFDLLVGTPYRLYWILTNTGESLIHLRPVVACPESWVRIPLILHTGKLQIR